ncbi:nicotinate-nucleotide--dimethylbenzimidazole phosphoribosyltransferase [Clostridium sp. BJN0001]|uniref:nicotinate-nucleotide--dimethylbenzimidazole phosphoribosyltransferase n=1 Tax=Clostridium sp. BJN0001 TaxID=2930219 RepID=UPI001FD4097A|nr:nicotinate-nucleotide--dimethylbenzimidazole phosphoribosyltransferase [Clostridium sp. BJN0001]
MKPAYKDAKDKALIREDSLAKPLNSLGKLESMAVKMCGITGKMNNKVDKRLVIVMCSDNGVIKEKVSSSPQIVTLSQTLNLPKYITGAGVIAKANNTELKVVDIGVNADISDENISNRKIRKSTHNIKLRSAMSYEEAVKSILIGIDEVRLAKEKGYKIIGTGEMGIGNTTTSSAVLISLCSCDYEKVIGRGGGLTDESLLRKKSVIKEALKVNNVDKSDPIDILSKVGGFDIGGMAGVFIGASYYRIPVVIDGFISAVAALIAYKLNKNVRDFIFTSHMSKEYGYNVALEEMNLSPILNLDMGLGEGSGCPLSFSIIETACAVLNNMATFKEAKIDDSYLDELRKNNSKE